MLKRPHGLDARNSWNAEPAPVWTKELSEEEMKKVDEALERLGFRYVERWNAWIY